MEFCISFDRNSRRKRDALSAALRAAIADGRIVPGSRLPSSRTLARALGLSRGTVIEALDLLVSEGLVLTRGRTGMWVSADARQVGRPLCDNKVAVPVDYGELPERYLEADRRIIHHPAQPFSVSAPEIARGFWPEWRRIAASTLRPGNAALLGYACQQGYRPLRDAITEHVLAPIGVACHPDQLMITAGAQHALHIALKCLFSRGQSVIVEDPCFASTSLAVTDADLEEVPVPVDDGGIDTDIIQGLADRVRGAVIAPSLQYPLGCSLEPGRRRALVEWAEKRQAWLFEDDYARELLPSRFGVQPLFAHTSGKRILYSGSFSKAVFPAMRIGYLVLPRELVPLFRGARALIDRHPPTLMEAMLAEYIRGGAYRRNLAFRRKVLARRRSTLVGLLREELDPWIDVAADSGGLHVIGWLKKATNDAGISEAAARNGIWLRPISPMYRHARPRYGFTFGYSGFDERQLGVAVRRLRLILESLRRADLPAP
jgi:GntR family transcriptional regulator / MocR family aminotransferase